MINRLKSKIKFSARRILNYLSDRQYKKKLKPTLSLKIRKHNECAVIIHMYYEDNWPLFVEKLKQLQVYVPFDLYITTTIEKEGSLGFVYDDFPDATMVAYENRGRDVLPFTNLLKSLSGNYDYFLKFHSKKSTHWDGGQRWLEEILDKLIPKSLQVADELVGYLRDGNTGIIGPSNYYYPLTVNFPANGVHISKVISRIYDDYVERDIAQINRSSYGFFGGTMFWGRFDAMITLVEKVSYSQFELEKGQVDATFAHALERLFCLVPEIDRKNIYESDGSSIMARAYRSDNIPEWSTDHEK